MSETATDLLETLQTLGVGVKHENGQLMINDTAGNVTADLRERLRQHKNAIMAELVLSEVKRPDNAWLDNDEFTRRYLILMRAYRNGSLDANAKDRGLSYLLNHWDNTIKRNGHHQAERNDLLKFQ
jgi:hypothetical protein